MIARGIEREAADRGIRRLQNSVLEADRPARRLLESLGYGPVRVFREMRIELDCAAGRARMARGADRYRVCPRA